MKQSDVAVLFVCLGNICRSPTAHGIFQGLVDKHQLSQQIQVDSCGTGDWHIGHAPDSRSAQAALRRGYDLSSLRARQFIEEDFQQFDYILAMDKNNLSDIELLRPTTHETTNTVDLFLHFSDISEPKEVPDPYYGGEDGFEVVLDLVEQASRNLLAKIIQRHQLD